MGEILTWTDRITFLGWAWLTMAFAFSLTYESWPHIRYRFGRWRIERRLARDQYILQEEMRELELAQGEKPSSFDLRSVLFRTFRSTVELSLPVMAFEMLDENIFPAAILGMVIFWGKLGRKEQAQSYQPPPEPTVYPREAKLGFAVAMFFCAVFFVWFAYLA